MYVQEIIKTKGKKKYRTVLIREGFREGKIVKNRTIANISKLPELCIEKIKSFFNKTDLSETFTKENFDQIQVLDSKEYGASYALISLTRKLGLDKMIFSKKTFWRENALAMIAGRLLYPGSKLSLTNMYADTSLWTLCGLKPDIRPDVNKHCYEVLDRLLSRQNAIQKNLSEKHLHKGCVVLYDITSSYFEGEYEDSNLVTYGYNRDRKKGYEQVNIGLLTNQEGCPIAVETFPGNTSDQVTVKGQCKKITEKFNIKDVIFVGDRGMLTPKRIEEVNASRFKTITALSHSQMQNLIDRNIISITYFSCDRFCEFIDPENPNIRYVLSLNQERKKQETATRLALIEKSKQLLDKIVNSKKKRKNNDIGAAAGKIWGKYRTENFFSWTIDNGKLKYELNMSVVDKEAVLDGCYIIRSDVDKEILSPEEVRKIYKKLIHVEQAFRIIKTTLLEIRPVFHQLDSRIRSHIFLCMLSYYLQWNVNKKLESVFKQDGKGKNRRWSFVQVIERLKSIRSQTLKISGISIQTISKADKEQQNILDKLGVAMLAEARN